MQAILERPSQLDQEVASASLEYFTTFITKSPRKRPSQRVVLRLQENDEPVTIPRKALELLRYILSTMAEGKAVTLVPSEAELSTQQAADVLNVSRPHLVKLLEHGQIPFKKVGSHRRIRIEDVFQYEQQQTERRNHHLQLLAEQAQELNLGF